MLQIEVYALFGLIWPGNHGLACMTKQRKFRVWEKPENQRNLHAHVLASYMYVLTRGKAYGWFP